MKDYLMIAEVLKPQGVRGEVKLKPYTADAGSFSRWKTLFLFDGKEYTPVPSRVSRIHDGFVYTVLGDCASMEDAEKFRSRELFIDRKHADPGSPDADFIEDLIGCEAVDENGTVIGTLTEVLQYGTVDTWVFKTSRGTMMAPALLAVFPETDVRAGKISVIADRLREVAVFED